MFLQNRLLSLAFISLCLCLISACGGNGGVKNKESERSLEQPPHSLFPLGGSLEWIYDNRSIAVKNEGKITVDGKSVQPLVFSTGEKEYFYSNSEEISFYGFYSPRLYVFDVGYFNVDVKFDSPIILYAEDIEVGDEIDFSGGGSVYVASINETESITFSATTEYHGEKEVTVPMGTFTAHEIELRYRITGTIRGESLFHYFSDRYFLVEGIGIVQRTKGSLDLNLVSMLGNDSDGDGVIDVMDAFENDPNETIDTDGDGIGNNSDPDDDNDGVADEVDAQPENRWVSIDEDSDGLDDSIAGAINVGSLSRLKFEGYAGTSVEEVQKLVWIGSDGFKLIDDIEISFIEEVEPWLVREFDPSNGVWTIRVKDNALYPGYHDAILSINRKDGSRKDIPVSYNVKTPTINFPNKVNFGVYSDVLFEDLSREFVLENRGDISITNYLMKSDFFKVEFDEDIQILHVEVNPKTAIYQETATNYSDTLTIEYENTYLGSQQISIPLNLSIFRVDRMVPKIELNSVSGASQWNNQEEITSYGSEFNMENVLLDNAESLPDWLSVVVDDKGHYNVVITSNRLPPKIYSHRLEFSTDLGSRFFVDAEFHVEEPSIEISETPEIVIDDATSLNELEIPIKFSYTGSKLNWTVNTNQEWLDLSIVSDTEEGGVVVQTEFDLLALEQVSNGEHPVEIQFLLNDELSSADEVNFSIPITLDFIDVQVVTPYVLFNSEPRDLTLVGKNLDRLQTNTISVGGEQVSNYRYINESEIRLEGFELPENGEYRISVSNNLNIVRNTSRVLVKDNPEYTEFTMELPGRAQELVFDAERQAIYGIFWNTNDRFAQPLLGRLQFSDNEWAFTEIDVDMVGAVALSKDGRELLVGVDNCEVIHLSADTLEVLHAAPILNTGSCPTGPVTRLFTFYDGEVLGGWNTPIIYQSDERGIEEQGDSLYNYSSVMVSNRYGSRMTYADRLTSQRFGFYNAETNSFHQRTLQSSSYSEFTFSYSFDAQRFMNKHEVYYHDYSYLGSVTTSTAARSWLGAFNERAYTTVFGSELLNVIDITAEPIEGIFPQIGEPISLPVGLMSSPLSVEPSHDGKTLFLFGSRLDDNSDYVFSVAVKNIPDEYFNAFD